MRAQLGDIDRASKTKHLCLTPRDMRNSLDRLYQAQVDFDVMRRHCDVAWKALETELQGLHDTMDREVVGMGPHAEEAYLSDINDFYIETAATLPRLQWYAQLLIAYGYFETTLDDVCTLIRRERQIEPPRVFRRLS